MKLSTTVNISESIFKIEHLNSIFLMGSCFAESIGEKLNHHKFNSCKNPFGIIYNPISLVKALKRIVNKEYYTEKELMHFNEKWISLDHHGSYS